MKRRQFLTNTLLAAVGAFATRSMFLRRPSELTSYRQGPVWSFEPVVGDGKWIWREPPKTERGYLEPFKKGIACKSLSRTIRADL